MHTGWQTIESGPPSADRTVLLLPGGMCSAGSYAELMSQPQLAGVRLVAATLPGHAGAEPPEDFSTEHYAEITAKLARDVAADVVFGFSMGAMVAAEMVMRGLFTGPTVLAGVSLSSKDDPAFARAIIRLTWVLGNLPVALAKSGASAMVKKVQAPPERVAELRADFARNNTGDMRQAMQAYLRWLGRGDDPARRLCESGAPLWIVHAEKGDGGLTTHERSVLAACPHASLVTIPGHVFFLPVEAPGPMADVILQALAA